MLVNGPLTSCILVVNAENGQFEKKILHVVREEAVTQTCLCYSEILTVKTSE